MSIAARRRVLLVAPFAAFFVVLLWITLPSGAGSLVGPYHLGLFDSPERVIEILGGSDAGSLLRAAESYQAFGYFRLEFHWVYYYWPPGMVAVDLVLLQLHDWLGLPIVAMMVLLNCALWAVLLGAWFTLIRKIGGWAPAVVLAVAALLSSAVAGWGLTSGMFYSDTFGAMGLGFAMLGLILVVRAGTSRRRLLWAVLAGVSLAGGAYFRAAYEIVADAALGVAVVVIVFALLARWRGAGGGFVEWTRRVAVPIGIMGVVAQALMLPWRAYLGLRIHTGDFRWSSVSDLASVARWLPESVMRERNILFGLTGHSNWACLGDPEQCKTVFDLEQTADTPYGGLFGGYFTPAQYDQMTLQSFLKHPLAFILERFDALGMGFASDTGGAIHSFRMPESIVMAVVFVAIVVVFFRVRAFSDPAYWFFFGATATQVATLTLIHMEPRYFLGIELSIILMGAYSLTTALSTHRNARDGAALRPIGRLDRR